MSQEQIQNNQEGKGPLREITPVENLSGQQKDEAAKRQAEIDTYLEEIPPQVEAEPFITEVVGLMDTFEKNHDINALSAITNLTFEEAKSHPTRQPALLELKPIANKLSMMKRETNINPVEWQTLYARYKTFTCAVGRLRDDNTIDHSI
jgi:hypothetical protein